MTTGRNNAGMTVIVKTVTKLTLGFIMIYGIYIALSGHGAPGGSFAGGVIVALSLVHIMLAYGKEVALNRMHSHALRFTAAVFSMVFLAVVMGQLCLGRPFGFLPKEYALPFAEMAIVGAGLFAIFVALVLLSKQDRDSE